MFRALSASSEFVSYGTYVAVDDELWAVTPNDDRICKDDRGGDLELVHVSARHGYRMFRIAREVPDTTHEVPTEFPTHALAYPCVVGDTLTVGFSHWLVRRDGSCVPRFVQLADPRKNGMPVISKKFGTFMGVYICASWFDAPSTMVPCDLFRRVVATEEWRKDDTALESVWSLEHAKTTLKPPRALELDDRIVAETKDGKAKWVGDAVPRRVVYETECRHLKKSFEDVVSELETGSRELEWADGSKLAFQNVVAHGFALRPRTRHAPEVVETTWPCDDWR